MRHSRSRLLLVGLFAVVFVMMFGNITTTDSQSYPDDFINDGTLFVYISLDEMNIKDYNLSNSLPINMEAPMDLFLQINATGTQTLNVSGSITFWYQGIALFPIQIVDSHNNTWFPIDPSLPIPPVTAPMNFAGMMSAGPISLATGVFEATVDFRYTVNGNSTLNMLQHRFSFLIPATPASVFTSITGITASIATVGAIYGVATGFNSLWEGLKTAYKLRSIHKKASELRSLPNLTVLGALPLLFSIVDSMKKRKKEGREDSGVSEYIVRQRLRDAAPDAWLMDRCPNCNRKWNKKLNMCKKCNFTEEDARRAYADLLSEKVPAAIRWVGKKKSTDVKTLAKKTKSNQYNAGVVAAAMVDTDVTEITKVGTPIKSFVMNIAGLAFLVVTWQQLLGDSSSTWQTTITMVGAALSLAVIIALYFTRKSQIEKFVADQEDGKKLLPTAEESEAEAKAETNQDESKEDLQKSFERNDDQTVSTEENERDSVDVSERSESYSDVIDEDNYSENE
jgi:hypothetical protein